MSNEIVIQAEGLGKRYRLGEMAPRRKLRESFRRWIASPVRTVLASPRHDADETPNEVRDKKHIWALRDVSFNVPRGEILGIVGRNGAGKSTLLKILTQITKPTTGLANIYGRVGSLLEVGTGFHPELTGRENVFLNGAILGMSRVEIKQRFDAIVEFSGVSQFLDTPIKRYSSGMQVRLAFAVAAHLEPEILIIDEVLAVGDAEFQKKCLGVMGGAARGGRTVLFVSHNMSAVQNLCTRALLLRDGAVVSIGDVTDVIDTYMSSTFAPSEGFADLARHPGRQSGMAPVLRSIGILARDGHGYRNSIVTGEDIVLEIGYDTGKAEIGDVAVLVNTFGQQRVLTAATRHCSKFNATLRGEGRILCKLPSITLTGGDYLVSVVASTARARHDVDHIEDALSFHVEFSDYFQTGITLLKGEGHHAHRSEWEVVDDDNVGSSQWAV